MLRRAVVGAIFLVATTATAQTTLTGRVVAIADGDSITVLDASKTQHRIRIAGIDAPERGQPGAQRSKESLAALVYDQPVRVESNKRDRYGRIIGKVWVASPDTPCRGKPD
jgi:endonuclease YncB( thermonuclease family)